MTSIVSERPSDTIFKSLNRLCDAKKNRAVTEYEFSDLISNIGDLTANAIRQGKLSENDIESLENYVTCLIGPNANNYFSHKHSGLDRAAKGFLEGNFVAIQERDKRAFLSQPVDNSFAKGLRKL